jgi:hypothetical protein
MTGMQMRLVNHIKLLRRKRLFQLIDHFFAYHAPLPFEFPRLCHIFWAGQ